MRMKEDGENARSVEGRTLVGTHGKMEQSGKDGRKDNIDGQKDNKTEVRIDGRKEQRWADGRTSGARM